MSENDFNTNSSGDYYNDGSNGSGGKGMAIASMVLGILSIILVCCNTYIGLACSIVGLVLGILHLRKNGKDGMAIAGIVCSAVAIVLVIVALIFLAAGLSYLGANGVDINSLLNQ